MNHISRTKLAAAGIAATMVAAPVAALGASTVNWQIPLKPSAAYRTANGSAQYQSQPGQREVQVEVQHVRSLAGHRVVFSAAGKSLGSARVSRRGQADITRNTERHQRVPSIAHGSRVTVRTTSGTLIVSGRF